MLIPAAHRALIVRKLKGLEDYITFTSVHWEMLEKGRSWSVVYVISTTTSFFARMAICKTR